MVFPGIGRQAWVSGSSGSGGTGRTGAWDTYDATADTAWQQMVDETSTALSSSYQVSYTENNSIRINSSSAYLAITNGSQEFLGFVSTDTADATSMSIKLNGGYSMTRPEIKNWGSNILMTSVADYGSIVLYKDSGNVNSGKISGLLTFQPSTTRHSVVAEYWEMPGIAATQYGRASNAYSLIMVTRNPNTETIAYTTGSTSSTNAAVWIHRVIENLDTLYSSPSSALTSLTSEFGFTISGNSYEQGYSSFYGYTDAAGSNPNTSGAFYNQVEANATAHGAGSEMLPRLMWTGDSNFKWMRHPTFNEPPNNAVAFTGAMLNWTPYHVTDGDSSGGNQAGVMWNITFNNHEWNLRHPFNTADRFWLDRPYSAGENGEYGDISVQNPDRIQYQGGQGRSETQLGEDLVQAIRLDSGQWIGLYGDSNGNLGGNLYVNAVARTQENLSQWTYRISPEYIVADDITTTNTHASSSVAVSTQNGVDSSSTAFDPNSAVLFKLSDNFFAVLWRKSTTAYISVFSAETQTSTPVLITREVDTVNLGTVPEGDLAGVVLGTGVALITCGNYYKFIKVPI